MDVWDLIELVKKHDLPRLKKSLKAGVDPNLTCQYTGTTALLTACEENNLEAAQILIAAGANPNCQHSDGYHCYDSTKSSEIKKFLLAHGFSLVLPEWSQSGFSLSMRLLSAVEPITQDWHLEMMRGGMHFKLEYNIYDSPPSKGSMRIAVGPNIWQVDLLEGQAIHQTETIQLEQDMKVTLNIQAQGFTGEFRVRLYELSVLDSELAKIITYPWPG